MVNYKDTLNLPRTKFPMRANLPLNELCILKKWNANNLYKMIRCKKLNKKFFLLHDGPLYANGNIHLGHAVNRVLKDIIIKFKGFSGYDAPYIPGWDCHGLPIELQVEKLIGKPDVDISAKEFRDACRQYVSIQIENQKNDFIRLGILGDWKHPYLTMDFKIEANIIRTLNKIISHGYLYKGVKPVHWCLKCCSAVANSEVEYYDHRSYAIDVSFSIVDHICIKKIFGINLNKKNYELIIWTTTPWTLPANQAVAVHPDYIYQLIEIFGNRYIIIAFGLIDNFMKRIKCVSWKVLGEIAGNFLEYVQVRHPFMSFNVPIVLSNHITLDAGTGIVHIAPSHGIDDYEIAQKYNFKKIVNLIDDTGYYLSNVHNALDGLHIFQSNKIIIDLLYKSNSILCVDDSYHHNYPYCWRHLTPLILKVTSQWFFNMDKHHLRQRLLNIIRKVDWIPNKSYFRMKSMIINRPDWCISRQRVWGVPMTLFVHKENESLHPNTCELMEIIAQRVETYGIQAWWDLNIEDVLSHKESMNYKKIYDVLDVWFDSGSTYDSVILEKLKFLCQSSDLYVEGSDQYRGWFMSSLIISASIRNCAPYKKVLSHGFTIDVQGRKMSKSLGNIIRPQDIVNKFGADILRLWIASSDYSKDLIISDDVLKNVVDIYRRIRNTVRFCLSNLNDFNPEKNNVHAKNMIELDRWLVDRTLSVQMQIISNYESNQLHNVVQRIMRFCSIEMGSFYLDVIKDRQYTTQKNSLARRSCQTALYHVVEAITRWIAPILSFTADEIWGYIPGIRSKYIFTEEWYTGLFKLDDRQILNGDFWKIFFNIREKVNKVIEKARIHGFIKGSLEADIILYVTPELVKKLSILNNELAFGLITSSAIVLNYSDFNISYEDKRCIEEGPELKIILKKSEGKKCLRCWHYTMDISQYKHYSSICYRCIQNISGLGENRRFF